MAYTLVTALLFLRANPGSDIPYGTRVYCRGRIIAADRIYLTCRPEPATGKTAGGLLHLREE